MIADSADSGQVTQLLDRLQDSPETLDRIMSLVYDDIHRIAHFQRQSMNMPSPRTTVLVHEAFIKLFGDEIPQINNRKHLKYISAMTVRHLIVDMARSQLAQKRGGGAWHTGLDNEVQPAQADDAEYVLFVEQTLTELEKFDQELAELIIGTYYGGYTASELAEMTGTSLRTVQRQLKRARGWLKFEFQQEKS